MGCASKNVARLDGFIQSMHRLTFSLRPLRVGPDDTKRDAVVPVRPSSLSLLRCCVLVVGLGVLSPLSLRHLSHTQQSMYGDDDDAEQLLQERVARLETEAVASEKQASSMSERQRFEGDIGPSVK